jgi:hypothetical protein
MSSQDMSVIDRGAKGGLKEGTGQGKIAGSPDGAQGDQLSDFWPWKEPGGQGQHGSIIGSPVGIEGRVRDASSPGRMGAMKRRLGG